MRFEVFLCFVLWEKLFVSGQEEDAMAEPLVNIQKLKDGFEIKSELITRFFNLLYSSQESSLASNSKNYPPALMINKSSKRLNIFGFQAPPEPAPRNPDGTLSSSLPSPPEVLHATRRPKVGSAPIFTVVSPPQFDDLEGLGGLAGPPENLLSMSVYPKLQLGSS
jgi:hypothetical protein